MKIFLPVWIVTSIIILLVVFKSGLASQGGLHAIFYFVICLGSALFISLVVTLLIGVITKVVTFFRKPALDSTNVQPARLYLSTVVFGILGFILGGLIPLGLVGVGIIDFGTYAFYSDLALWFVIVPTAAVLGMCLGLITGLHIDRNKFEKLK